MNIYELKPHETWDDAMVMMRREYFVLDPLWTSAPNYRFIERVEETEVVRVFNWYDDAPTVERVRKSDQRMRDGGEGT